VTEDPPTIDVTRLAAEIAEEVRARRAAGDFPPGLERELDAMFARYAPAGTGDDFDDVLAAAETQSFIHADVPTGSRRAPLVLVKRVLRSAMAWYVRFLAQQVTAFAGSITRAVTLLARRVDTLETVAPTRVARSTPDPGGWAPTAVDAVAGVPGRVLHTESGAGAVVRALVDAGVDAYGVDPDEGAAVAAAREGLDVRVDDALAHLRRLPDASLGAVVLSGCIDELALGEVLAIAGRAAAAVAAGGTVVVLSAGPRAWAGATDPVAADLSPGRPLHAETWAHVLTTAGLAIERTLPLPAAAPPERLTPLPADVPGAEILNADLDRLSRAVFGAGGYALVARKPH